MVDKKLDVVSSSLKDNFLLILIFSLFLFSTTSCEKSFQNFDQNLIEKKKELEEFNEKSIMRKEEILNSQDENN